MQNQIKCTTQAFQGKNNVDGFSKSRPPRLPSRSHHPPPRTVSIKQGKDSADTFLSLNIESATRSKIERSRQKQTQSPATPMSSCSCPHFNGEKKLCIKLCTVCIPGRAGCVLRGNSVFAFPAEERIAATSRKNGSAKKRHS